MDAESVKAVFEAGEVVGEGYDAMPNLEGKGLWYFWDETWAHWYGPYKSKGEADRALARYIETELR